jgi:hypothetical protein
MKRSLLSSAFGTCLLVLSSSAFAQSAPATPAPATPGAATSATPTPAAAPATAPTTVAPAAPAADGASATTTTSTTTTSTTTTEAPKPPVETPPAAPVSVYERPGMMGDFHVGVEAGFGVSLKPIRFGLNLKYGKYLSGNLNYGIFPLPKLGSVEVSMSGFQGLVRLHPLGGAFFIGAGIGTNSFSATATTGVATAKAEMTVITLDPTIGWLWQIKAGDSASVTIGLDLGVQVGLAGDVKITDSTGTNVVNTELSDAANVAKGVFPQFNLFKLGVMF